MLQEKVTPRLNLGPSVLKLELARQILLPETKVVKKVEKSLPKIEEEAPAAPVTPAVTSPVSSVSSEAKANIRELYKAELRARIEENKYYPPLSRRLGQMGTVIVAFTLLEDGHIIDLRIDTPSRYESLNNSALDAVKKVHVFKPIPKELGESRMDIKVPVKFVTI